MEIEMLVPPEVKAGNIYRNTSGISDSHGV